MPMPEVNADQPADPVPSTAPTREVWVLTMPRNLADPDHAERPVRVIWLGEETKPDACPFCDYLMLSGPCPGVAAHAVDFGARYSLFTAAPIEVRTMTIPAATGSRSDVMRLVERMLAANA
ncbi:hypothetical protein SUDANB95_07875 (plasmid) [Actinosynnema sp. ALI-1.44]